MTNKDASPNAAGYGYQYERALHRIFHSPHPGTRFGIETADDIEEIIPLKAGSKLILEQDKLTTLSKNPLQDSSKNLWNTLRNWLSGLAKARDDYAFLEFVLVTNKIVGNGTLARTLSDATSPTSVSDAISALRNQANLMAGAVGEIAADVAACNDDDLAFLISHLHVAEGLDEANMKEAIFAALQFPDGLEHCQNIIYESLLGTLVSACLDSWKKREPYWTNAQPYFTRKHLLFEQFLEVPWKPLSQEETGYKKLLDEYGTLDLPFIDQLRNINIMERAVQKELGHYWAAYSERTRLLASGRILPIDLTDAESILHDRWDGFCEAHIIRTCKEPEDFVAEDYRAIYAQTSTPDNYEMTLGRVKSSYRYLFMGTYHHQVNADGSLHPIHWHYSHEGDE